MEILNKKKPSLLVIAIGDMFMPGVRDALEAAAIAYGKAGGECCFEVQHNLTVIPPLGLGAMRNLQIEQACLRGFDYLAITDNDVLVDDPETFIKLIGRSKGYIVPWFDQGPIGANILIMEPMFTRGQGLLKLGWTTPFFNLFDMKIFRAMNCYRPFTDSMIYDEDRYNSWHFRCHGIDIWQDTETAVKLLRGPRMLWETMESKVKILKPFENP